MHQRIDITLPIETVKLIDRVSSKGNRSRLIGEAVRHFIEVIGRENLKKRLKEGAIRRADRDLRLAQDWFDLEQQVWQRKRK